jgi:hypothetical protein
MVPVINLPMAVTYRAYGFNRTLVYQGPDLAAADAAVAAEKLKFSDRPFWSGDFRVEVEAPTLPDGKFYVGTTAKGTVAIFGGSDDTNRCLLHVRVTDGYRGSSKLVASGGVKLVAYAEARAACDGACEGLYILEVGQTVVAHRVGRRVDEVLEYRWDGNEVVTTRYTGAEWNAQQDLQASEPATRM